MNAETAFLILLCVGAAVTQSVGSVRLGFGFCSSDSDCDAGQCCVLTMGRYARPMCQGNRKENEGCRPETPDMLVSQKILISPSETMVIKNVHMHLCPCDAGLSCDRQQGGVCLVSNDA